MKVPPKVDEYFVKYVCGKSYFFRNINNLIALVIVPAVALGLMWGWVYHRLLIALTDEQVISSIIHSAHMAGYEWVLASICPLIVTYFMQYPLCRAIQVCLPEKYNIELHPDA